MSERYQNCPVCGSLCTIGGDKKEGTHYYVPVSGNAEFAAAPAAKPIVWDMRSDGKCLIGDCGNFEFEIWQRFDGSERYYLYSNIDGFDDIEFASIESAKQAAQDRLNKLVAECAVMGNPTPQFTAEEIEAIRKIAQFMGVTVADSIIAKCDAMLKGAQG